MSLPPISCWFESKSRTLYLVSGATNHERIKDVVRGARFEGIRVYPVTRQWAEYTRKHDPFAHEIDLMEKSGAGRLTVGRSIATKLAAKLEAA